MKRMEDRQWKIIQQMLAADASGAEIRPMVSQRTLFGIPSSVDIALQKIVEEDEMKHRDIETLRKWIDECAPGRLVFFGGAGVSTESGIPDFRSADGLYAQKYGDTPPEQMISRSYFDRHPERFFEFYFDRMIAREAQPNRAHRKLAELEAAGTLSAIVTQNIDGLHQAAGSHAVYELHGSVLRNYCMKCGAPYDLDAITALHEQADDGVPRCPDCGGIVKPDVVLYEESLDGGILEASVRSIANADVLIVAGTSLAVYPAAGLIDYFHGDHLAIINLSPTPRDRYAEFGLRAEFRLQLGVQFCSQIRHQTQFVVQLIVAAAVAQVFVDG